jgi:hypothetical protein
MPALDAQLHPYGRNRPGRPWVGTRYGLAEVPGDRMAAATARYWFHRSACIATMPATPLRGPP